MGPILLYAPVLMCLPVLLVVGLVFVLVPGGFIIVLGALYWGSVQFIGLAALAARRRRRAARSRTRPARPTWVLAPQAERRRLEPAAVAPGAPAVALRYDRAPGPAPNVVVHRPRAPVGTRILSADIGQGAEPQDDARAA